MWGNLILMFNILIEKCNLGYFISSQLSSFSKALHILNKHCESLKWRFLVSKVLQAGNSYKERLESNFSFFKERNLQIQILDAYIRSRPKASKAISPRAFLFVRVGRLSVLAACQFFFWPCSGWKVALAFKGLSTSLFLTPEALTAFLFLPNLFFVLLFSSNLLHFLFICAIHLGLHKLAYS